MIFMHLHWNYIPQRPVWKTTFDQWDSSWIMSDCQDTSWDEMPLFYTTVARGCLGLLQYLNAEIFHLRNILYLKYLSDIIKLQPSVHSFANLLSVFLQLPICACYS